MFDLLIADHIEPNGAYRSRAIEELRNLVSWTEWVDPSQTAVAVDMCTAEAGVAAVVCLGPGVRAAPTIAVEPGSIERERTAPIELTVGNLTGASVELTLWVDADQSGAVNAGDYQVWADSVPDDSYRWSPLHPFSTINVRKLGFSVHHHFHQ